MSKQIKSRGFTIVELLIVIVIIAILAAITIVAYNGITARAHSSAAQAAAQNVSNKAEAYNAIQGNYPATWGALTAAPNGESYFLPATAVSIQTTAFGATFTGKDNTLTMSTCVNTGSSTVVGNVVTYWDFTKNLIGVQNAGDTSGTCTVI